MGGRSGSRFRHMEGGETEKGPERERKGNQREVWIFTVLTMPTEQVIPGMHYLLHYLDSPFPMAASVAFRVTTRHSYP